MDEYDIRYGSVFCTLLHGTIVVCHVSFRLQFSFGLVCLWLHLDVLQLAQCGFHTMALHFDRFVRTTKAAETMQRLYTYRQLFAWNVRLFLGSPGDKAYCGSLEAHFITTLHLVAVRGALQRIRSRRKVRHLPKQLEHALQQQHLRISDAAHPPPMHSLHLDLECTHSPLLSSISSP